ncbi:putative spermidine/putrescine transport system substrate-binding protein [Nocardioides marinisabuli]|uniref:Putative spermidine/putrescine transport system substrate-binding protein n=1 Tax=Nocardioides marinisabuli TaxID=419476 RepID=A0A7Y9F0Z8_9ACTN|nr:ABC transporter substrate-binding protein [Nocardioides marinisabuli]NYD57602.1 putative spermidine/putrescine transport system substrate-binding protein [Nocardioides marinisabuli]
MRKGIAVIAVGSLAALATACGGADGSTGEKALTYVSWGGALQEAQTSAFLDPFAEQASVTVRQDSPTDYAKLKAQAESGSVEWDVVQVEPYIAERGCEEGWLTPLPDSVRSEGLMEEFASECAVPAFQYAFVIGYNTDQFPDEHPTTWGEFFDTEAFPGKRAFWKFSSSGILEAALIADGVAPDALYPLDLDRAFAKLDTIKDDIVFYDTGEQQTQLVASGEVAMVQAWNGRMYDAITNDEPVGLEWGDHLVVSETWVVPKGAPHEAQAMEFLEYATGAEPQAALSKYIPYSPINEDAVDQVDAEMAPYLPTSPENAEQVSTSIDYSWYAENFDEVNQRFNDWLLTL